MIASPPKQLTTIRSKYSHRCVVRSGFTRSIKYLGRKLCVLLVCLSTTYMYVTYSVYCINMMMLVKKNYVWCCLCSVFYEVAKVPALSEESLKSWDWPFPCDKQAYPHPLQNMLCDNHKTIQWPGCVCLFLKSICAEKEEC